ncbi:hypothetical protein VR41_12555 [Streptomyces sp. NRRL B-1568]|nr:hypothetical protein VR41_12555 [Streptomyces sp. NRRL B-1568]
MVGALKFTIDTETDSYEDAIRRGQAAYHRSGEALTAVRQEASGGFEPEVWTAPGWESFGTCIVDGIDAARLGGLAAGRRLPHCVTEMSRVTRRLNRAALEFRVDGPLIVKESARRRVADPAVAAIVMDELTEHPLWPQMRHHTHPP